MKKLNSVNLSVSSENLDGQINEVVVSRLSREDKQKALIELGLKKEDLRIIYGGIFYNPHAPIRVVTPTGFTLTFGVEMECIVDRNRVTEAARVNNTSIAYEGYNHVDGKSYYKFVTDASVRANNGDDSDNEIECVSPILKSRAGLKSLENACKSLNEADAYVNKSCGLHVHVGAQDLKGEEIVNVYKNYQMLEGIIDSFMAESRRGNENDYCKSIRGFDYTNCHSASDVRVAMRGDRYYKVNPCAYSRHQTIEFRQHQGSTNFKKVSMWVNFCVKLVEWSRTNVLTEPVAKVDDIAFLSATQKKFFKARINEFASR